MRLVYLLLVTFIVQPLLSQKSEKDTIQEPNRNQIGLQLNPYLDQNLLEGYLMEVVFGVRYSYKITTHFSVGPEINGFTPIFLTTGDFIDHFRLGAGIFTRYTLFKQSRARVFTEISTYYAYWYREETQYLPELRENKLGFYLSPGLSLFSKSRRFSIDLYMKLSNVDFVNGKHYVFSYKVNYHF